MPVTIEITGYSIITIEFDVDPGLVFSLEEESIDSVFLASRVSYPFLLNEMTLKIPIEIRGRGSLNVLTNPSLDLFQFTAGEVPLLSLPKPGIGTGIEAECDADGAVVWRVPSKEDKAGMNNMLQEPREWLVEVLDDSDLQIGGSETASTADLVRPNKEGEAFDSAIPEANIFLLSSAKFPGDFFPKGIKATSTLADVASMNLECCTDEQCNFDEELGTVNPDGTRVCDISGTTSTCVSRFVPVFTLAWTGDDDLDIHVITPRGNEIAWFSPSQDFGALDNDDIPSRVQYNIETISWSFEQPNRAPEGEYIVFVDLYTRVEGSDSWVLRWYDGVNLLGSRSGSGDSSFIRVTYPPASSSISPLARSATPQEVIEDSVLSAERLAYKVRAAHVRKRPRPVPT